MCFLIVGTNNKCLSFSHPSNQPKSTHLDNASHHILPPSSNIRSAGGPLKLLVADEPTSGLDAFTAHTVLKLMKTFAVEQQVGFVMMAMMGQNEIVSPLKGG